MFSTFVHSDVRTPEHHRQNREQVCCSHSRTMPRHFFFVAFAFGFRSGQTGRNQLSLPRRCVPFRCISYGHIPIPLLFFDPFVLIVLFRLPRALVLLGLQLPQPLPLPQVLVLDSASFSKAGVLLRCVTKCACARALMPYSTFLCVAAGQHGFARQDRHNHRRSVLCTRCAKLQNLRRGYNRS
jgi:hypothetical protein